VHKKGCYTRQLHKGGVHLGRLGGMDVNVAGSCVGRLEALSAAWDLGS